MAFLTYAEDALYSLIDLAIILIEFLGVFVLVYTAIKCFYKWIKKEPTVRLELAQGISLALGFKMGGEVLRTVVVRHWAELGILGAVIVLRGMLTFLLHWEIKNEEKDIARLSELAGKDDDDKEDK